MPNLPIVSAEQLDASMAKPLHLFATGDGFGTVYRLAVSLDDAVAAVYA